MFEQTPRRWVRVISLLAVVAATLGLGIVPADAGPFDRPMTAAYDRGTGRVTMNQGAHEGAVEIRGPYNGNAAAYVTGCAATVNGQRKAPCSLSPTFGITVPALTPGKTYSARVLSANGYSYFDYFDVPNPAPPSTTTCAGRAVTIPGTWGPDNLYGTPGNDVIHGMGGHDKIHGGGGNDIICGGEGNDKLWGGDGKGDYLYGEAGGQDLCRDTTSPHFSGCEKK